jgi:hypothetical protein
VILLTGVSHAAELGGQAAGAAPAAYYELDGTRVPPAKGRQRFERGQVVLRLSGSPVG